MSTYILNTHPGREPVAVQVNQGDKNYALEFEIYDDNMVFDLTSATVVTSLIKPDNTKYVGIAAVTNAAAGAVSVMLDDAGQMTAASGEGVLELIIFKSGERVATGNVRFIIEAGTSGTTSGDAAGDLTALAEQVAANTETAQNAASQASQALTQAQAAAEDAEAAAARTEAIAIGDIRDTIFPVGSIVQYTDASIDPNSLYSGTTWQRIEGRFLFGADNSHAGGTTGGSETVTLTWNQMPAHRHFVLNMNKGTDSPDYQHTLARTNIDNSIDEGAHYRLYGNSNDAGAGKSSPSGNSEAHNNMPPYVAVYIWQRTA